MEIFEFLRLDLVLLPKLLNDFPTVINFLLQVIIMLLLFKQRILLPLLLLQ
jgi:hypothetical protein